MFFEITKVDENRPINFMNMSKPTAILSVILLLIAIVSLSTRGLNWGLDFTGGTLVEVGFSQPANLEELRDVLAANEFDDAIVQNFGSSRDVLVRVPPRLEAENADAIGEQLFRLLSTEVDSNLDLRRVEFVGPSVGEELAEAGGLAMIVAAICILIYVSFRFEWRIALASVIGLVQDVIMVLGLFSLLQVQLDLTILAALLAVIGYSLNDSIVISDRIRENFLKLRNTEVPDVINISLSQCLSRTLITSLTTIMVLLTLYFFGGQMVNGFALAMLVGVVVGTYSSTFTRTTIMIALGISREDLLPPEVEKEGQDQENMI
ncbi:protein translocase subunit SecF [Aliidiomarina maris]|uniref:Protein-export membrane protein SecF n=1 Tax=Aliidiomarina maris TaxID=531312 RepID=A0A327WSU1_9GAMM|nr:protein translocase subunit SecF [Aliidiomarina maris]MCL5049535.1 protein translocase subunit SecF [Bacillota bacterium]RAJ95374.1 protein translocase subunit secF [Aliidiomarina maris]RUO22734.1 protein translocase subunit SecF [Aliidiomarina maris]